MLRALTRHNALLKNAVAQLATSLPSTNTNSASVDYFDLLRAVGQMQSDFHQNTSLDTTGSCITHRLLYPGMRGLFSAALPGTSATASALSSLTRMLNSGSGGAFSLSETFFSSGARCKDPERFFWYDEGTSNRLFHAGHAQLH
jgi:hypothetical protein